LDDAVASKDFAKAGKLNEKIDMHKNIVGSEKSKIGKAMEVTGGKTRTSVISVDGREKTRRSTGCMAWT
jgi:hypothetical protein